MLRGRLRAPRPPHAEDRLQRLLFRVDDHDVLVSVSERTREIGVPMAVCAKPQHVLAQFLVQAMVLSRRLAPAIERGRSSQARAG